MRLIDADKLIAKYCAEGCGCSRDECGYTYAQNKYDCCQFVAEIEQAPTVEVQKWHSVEDELPEPDEEVLIYAKGLENENDGVITVSHYTHNKYGFSIKGWVEPWQYFESNYRITHWMELPKPPKEDEE